MIEIITFPSNESPALVCAPSDTVDIGTQISISVAGFHSAQSGTWIYNDAILMDTGLTITVPTLNLVNPVSFEYLDPFGCPVIVEGACYARDVEPRYPKAFTPNNDELNDRFRPLCHRTLQSVIAFCETLIDNYQ